MMTIDIIQYVLQFERQVLYTVLLEDECSNRVCNNLANGSEEKQANISHTVYIQELHTLSDIQADAHARVRIGTVINPRRACARGLR